MNVAVPTPLGTFEVPIPDEPPAMSVVVDEQNHAWQALKSDHVGRLLWHRLGASFSLIPTTDPFVKTWPHLVADQERLTLVFVPNREGQS